MVLHRLMFCSKGVLLTLVVLLTLTMSASAADRSKRSPFRTSPLAAPHHGSINATANRATKPVKAQKPTKVEKVGGSKSHFWDR